MTKSEYLAKVKQWQDEKIRLVQIKESPTNEEGNKKTHRDDFLATRRTSDNRQKRNVAFRKLFNSLSNEQKAEICNKFQMSTKYGFDDAVSRRINDHNIDSAIEVQRESIKTVLYPDIFIELTEEVLQLIDDESLLEESINSGELVANMPYSFDESTNYFEANGFMDSVKEALEASDKTPDEKESFLKELERANSCVLGDSEERTWARSSYGIHLNDAILSDYHEEMNNLLSNPEYAKLSKLLKQTDSKMNGGAMKMKTSNDKLDHKEEYKEFLNSEFKLSDDAIERAKKVINKMRELDLIPDKHIEAEQGDKIYAFQTTVDAISDIEKAADTFDTDALKEATDRYNREISKMRELYEFAKDLVGTEEKNFPGNVDNNRSKFIPPEFKKSHQLNAMLNGLFLTAIYVRNNNLELDDYLKDPFAANRAAVEKMVENISAKNQFDRKNLGAALASMSKLEDCGFDIVRFEVSRLRPLEVLITLEKDETKRAFLNAAAVFSEDHASDCYNQKKLPSIFFAYHADSALKNLFLVPDAQNKIESLIGTRTQDMDKLEYVPPFDAKEYVALNKISPKDLHERIVNTFEEYIKAGGDNNHLTAMAVAAREAAMLAKTLNAYSKDMPGYRDLNNFILNPNAALQKAMGDRVKIPTIQRITKNPLDSISKKDIDNATKAKSKEVKQLRKDEKNVNKQLDKLNKEIAKLQKAADKAQDGSLKKKENLDQIAAKKAAVSTLTNDAIKKLEADFKNGKVPAVYYEQRTKSLEAGDYKKQNAMFVEGLSDKKSFLAAQMEQGVDKKTATAKFKELSALEKKGIQQYAARTVLSVTETKLHEIKLNEIAAKQAKEAAAAPKVRNISPDELNISRTKQQQKTVERAAPQKQIDELSIGSK